MSRITKILTADVQEVTCDRPFCVHWYDRKGRPGIWVFEKFREYTLDVEPGDRYRLPLPASHTLRDMVSEYGVLRATATEAVQVWAANVSRENAKALDEIRFAQVVFHYDPTQPEEYLKWRRIYPQATPGNTISERWDRVNEVTLLFRYDPVFNL